MVEEKKNNPEERFRYIGFEVYSGKEKEFWKDETEKKSFLERVKLVRKGSVALERDYSLVHVEAFSKLDKIVVILGSALMIISFFLPWFSLGGMHLNAIGFISKLSLLLGYSAFSSFALTLSAILFLMIMFLSVTFGVLSLVTVFKKNLSEMQFQQKLKNVLRLAFLPLILFGIILVLTLVGIPSPFLSGWGIKGVGENFTLVSLFSISGLGLWMAIVGIILNCVKVSDL
jgi:hypothetical protein